MKVIDILNKIANGEEVPYRVKYYDIIYRFDFSAENSKMYVRDETGIKIYLFEVYDNLNDEVEIIEEDIRKLPNEVREPHNFEEVVYIAEDLVNKINEIIDYINKEK